MAMKKKMALGTSAAALALVAGLGLAGVASAADSGSSGGTTSTTQSAPAERGGPDGHRGGGQEMASGLAEKLGVDESKLSDALDTFRKANKPTERPASGRHQAGSHRDGFGAGQVPGRLAGPRGIQGHHGPGGTPCGGPDRAGDRD